MGREGSSAVMIGNEFGLALVESMGLDPKRVSSYIKLNMVSDEMFSVDFRVNLTVEDIKKACDIINDKDSADAASKQLIDDLRGVYISDN